MRWEDLTDRQRAAAESRVANLVVVGGPGSGKTSVALWAARRAIESGELASHERALFLAFSRTAVGQILRRAPDVVAGLRNRVEVMTYDALGWRLIRAFGRYGGHGNGRLVLQSAARTRLQGQAPNVLVYEDLVPGAIQLASHGEIGRVIRRRWPLIICDEAQDMSEKHAQLIEVLAPRRRIMLADQHQMIYGWIAGVGPERYEQMIEDADEVIELEVRSHRDPSGAIPAMADAVRRRDFASPALVHAVTEGVLRVADWRADQGLDLAVLEELRALQAAGCKSVGVAANSNENVSALSAGLGHNGVAHTLVGISEAHAEGLEAMVVLSEFAVGLADEEQVGIALASFVTACSRGKVTDPPPPLALQIARNVGLPGRLGDLIQELKEALRTAGGEDVLAIGRVAASAWRALSLASGKRPWQRAAADFRAMLRVTDQRLGTVGRVKALRVAVGLRKQTHLLQMESAGEMRVQVMTFAQTKGREFDGMLLVNGSNDFFGYSGEPFTDASRTLFVALTRARVRVTVLLPEAPHALFAPLAELMGG